MLIISRTPGERVFIDGRRVKIQVLGIRGHQVRLGIEAPGDVSVHREEVYLRIQQERREEESAAASVLT